MKKEIKDLLGIPTHIEDKILYITGIDRKIAVVKEIHSNYIKTDDGQICYRSNFINIEPIINTYPALFI